jgi:hypothetical protein
MLYRGNKGFAITLVTLGRDYTGQKPFRRVEATRESKESALLMSKLTKGLLGRVTTGLKLFGQCVDLVL